MFSETIELDGEPIARFALESVEPDQAEATSDGDTHS
jgi:hypothetical protein